MSGQDINEAHEVTDAELEAVSGGIDKKDVGLAIYSLVYGAYGAVTTLIVGEAGVRQPLRARLIMT